MEVCVVENLGMEVCVLENLGMEVCVLENLGMEVCVLENLGMEVCVVGHWKSMEECRGQWNWFAVEGGGVGPNHWRPLGTMGRHW